MPPKKKTTKKKSTAASNPFKAMPSVPEALRADLRLPPISDIRSDSLNCAVVNSDAKSLNRLIAHYNHEEVLNKVDGNGSTPIHVATMHKDADMVDLLLSYEKIDLNILQPKIIGGYAALHIACNVKEPRIISSLLNAGANPNIKSNSIIGETPLQICCKLGYVAGAKLLISAGASIELRDNFGNNASFWAYNNHQDHFIKELALPPPRAATADEMVAILQKRIPFFTLPTVKAKKGKGKKGGGKKKK